MSINYEAKSEIIEGDTFYRHSFTVCSLEKPRDFDPFGQNSIDHLAHIVIDFCV